MKLNLNHDQQTWISNSSSDSVSLLEKKLDDPRSDESTGAGDAYCSKRVAVDRHIDWFYVGGVGEMEKEYYWIFDNTERKRE